MAQAGAERLNLGALDPQQLMSAKKTIENDIQRFAESMQFFNRSANIYNAAGVAIGELGEAKEGQQLLLPLTQSLYVPGTIAATNEVLIDIGTNYYVEMSTENGQEYCKRKIDKLRQTMEGLQQVLRMKQNQLIQVEKELASKMATAKPSS